MSRASWFPYNTFSSKAKIRLFCFSHAGGIASSFRLWQSYLPSHIEVCPLQLPGRENRFREPFITNMEDLIDEIWPYISSLLDCPFAFFGHSLGGIVAYELAKKNQLENKIPPVKLFISAASAPDSIDIEQIFHQLPDDRFIQHLKKYGGLPEQLLQDKDAMDVFLPRLRADFTLFETYRDRFSCSVNTPIVVLGGTQDHIVGLKNLQAWEKYTKSSFTLQLFQGDHFYLQKHSEELCQGIIKQQLLYPTRPKMVNFPLYEDLCKVVI